MSRIKSHHKQLSLQYQQYKQSGGKMSWNDFQKQSVPSKLDTDYIQLLEYVKSHSLRDRRSLSSMYNKIKKLFDLYSAEATATYTKFVLSDYEDEVSEKHYAMCRLRLDRLRTMLDCVFQTYNEYDQMQEERHATVDKSILEGVGKFYFDDEDPSDD